MGIFWNIPQTFYEDIYHSDNLNKAFGIYSSFEKSLVVDDFNP